MPLTVKVKLGKHTLPVKDETEICETVINVLASLNIPEGRFELHHGRVCSGPEIRGVRYVSHNVGGIRIHVSPGNNSKCLDSGLIVRRPNTVEDVATRLMATGFVAYQDTKTERQKRMNRSHIKECTEGIDEDRNSDPLSVQQNNGERMSTKRETVMKKRNFYIQDVFRFHTREVKATMATLADLFGSRPIHSRILTTALIVTLEQEHRLFLRRNTPEEVLKGFVDHGHVEFDSALQTARVIHAKPDPDESTSDTTTPVAHQRLLTIGAIATVLTAEIGNAKEILDLEKAIATKLDQRALIEEELTDRLLRVEEMREQMRAVEVEIALMQDALDSHPSKEVVGLLRKIRADVLAIDL